MNTLIVPNKDPGVPSRVLMALLRGYQVSLSPLLHAVGGGGCRFHPTCSAYAIEAVRKYGALAGSYRGLRRLMRCHPLHPGGFDPP
ncbi:MAG: membrane protein insertion efficiency factor YidD [Deltaproteobacteria bacterium]|nr:membrane protein insertion efficiency factor YidD [Deltaproteobacteria bacterium]